MVSPSVIKKFVRVRCKMKGRMTFCQWMDEIYNVLFFSFIFMFVLFPTIPFQYLNCRLKEWCTVTVWFGSFYFPPSSFLCVICTSVRIHYNLNPPPPIHQIFRGWMWHTQFFLNGVPCFSKGDVYITHFRKRLRFIKCHHSDVKYQRKKEKGRAPFLPCSTRLTTPFILHTTLKIFFFF